MNLAQKIARIFSLLLLLFLATSCEEGCVQADEFDVDSFVIESNPVDDGIQGTYDHYVGGQKANWHNTYLYSNGDRFLIQITGQWTPWNGELFNDDTVEALQKCTFCAKNPTSPNCICYDGQNSHAENSIAGNQDCLIDSTLDSDQCVFLSDVDCSGPDQDDPAKCTCTKNFGNALDYGIYHFPLNYYEKEETPKIADRHIQCKYDQGMGAYIGLFGRNGVTTPKRVYHLFSETEVCNVPRNAAGECVDSSGDDATAYVFTSANNRIFMKDDKNGNDGLDRDSSDDEYHGPNELVQAIIYDGYYADNYGRYNIAILRGVGPRGGAKAGLLEFIVSMVEDVILGEVNDEGVREGGIVEFMYKAIVKDSGFGLAVQVALSLYIALYGAAHLFGVVEMNKKEIMSRLMKIALVIFFVSDGSWKWYNEFVVNFFKDGMDYLVTIIMDISDRNIDSSSLIEIAKMDREVSYSQSTRFSYVDTVIKKLLSEATAKKIFGLFFTEYFGWLYIILMYVLIGYFIYVMLLIGSIYLVNLLKIVFVLAIGPIFIVFTLFKHTRSMFRNWLGFLGGRSFEIIVLFTVLYNFLVIIDKKFTGLLAYKSCLEKVGSGPFSIKVLLAQSGHSFMDWLSGIVIIAGLIFITKAVVDKAADLAGAMFSINIDGDSAGSGASGAGKMAGGALGGVASLLGKGAGALKDGAQFAGKYGLKGLKVAARKSGVADAWNAAGKALPFRGIRTRARDGIIDGALKRAEAKAGDKKGPERDAFIKQEALKDLNISMYNKSGKFEMAGVDMTTIARRFDKKMVEEPLQKFLKDRAKALKDLPPGQVPLGKDMRDRLRADAKKWAEDNLSGADAEKVDKLLNSSLKKTLNSASELSSSEAAKAFGRSEEDANRYLQYLKDKEFERHDAKHFDAKSKSKKGKLGRGAAAVSRGYHNLGRDTKHNPRLARDNFLRKAKYKRDGRKGVSKINPLNRINVVDKSMMTAGRGIRAAGNAAARAVARKFGFSIDKYQSKTTADRQAAQRSTLVSSLEKLQRPGLSDADKRRKQYFESQLSDIAGKEARDALAKIRKTQSKGGVTRSAKQALFDNMKASLTASDGKSLMEKLTGLSAMHKALGLSGKDPKEALLDKMSKKYKDEAGKIAKGVADGSLSSKEAEEKKKELADLEKGLMSGSFRGDIHDALSENFKAMQDAIDSDKKLLKDKDQKDPDNKDAQEARDKEMKEAQERMDEKISKAKALEEEKEAMAKKQEALNEALEKVRDPDISAEDKRKYAQKLHDELNGDAGGHLAASAEYKAKIQEAEKELEAVLADGSVSIEDKDAAVAKAQEKVQEVIPMSFEVEFGASASDLLMKDPDIGLKASDPLLGKPPSDPNDIDHAAVAALNINKNSIEGRVRMAKMQQKIKEFEKSKIDPSDREALAKIDKEIDEIKDKIFKQENQLAKVDSDIKAVTSS